MIWEKERRTEKITKTMKKGKIKEVNQNKRKPMSMTAMTMEMMKEKRKEPNAKKNGNEGRNENDRQKDRKTERKREVIQMYKISE